MSVIIETMQPQPGFVTDNPMGAPLQGRDSIVINAASARLWALIADSTRLLDWGPPVRAIKVLGTPGQAEGVGSYRRVDVDFNGQTGHFIERRVEHIEGKRMRFVIEQETLGLARVMVDTGSSLELERITDEQTRVIFSFYHRPKGVFGHIMNRLMILRQQRRNRLAALESLKAYAESLD